MRLWDGEAMIACAAQVPSMVATAVRGTRTALVQAICANDR